MDSMHRYIKLGLHIVAALIFSYVTLATAAEILGDQHENSFEISGKTISVMDIYHGDVVRIHTANVQLQDVLFPIPGNTLSKRSSEMTLASVLPFGNDSGLQVECAVHPRTRANTGTRFN